ncbi:putative flavoprotein [Cunninghamella echinulata]|nr:putative flavoprotein [Cunninghamella echinulata]
MVQQHELRTLIIGCGFSGIDAAIQLRKQLNVVADIMEYGSDIGGTWHANKYPGCECDVRSHLYSLSYELNPNWSKAYSSQSEILAYIKNVATKYKIYDQVQLNTLVLSAEWDSDRNQWKVRYASRNSLDKVETKYYHFIFNGIGPLRIPKIPKMFENFKGKVVHTAKWDSSIDFTNKKVVLIGNGSSAVQALPELQKQVKHLYNFQRSKAWITPKVNTKYGTWIKFCFRWIPLFMRFYRWYIYWTNEFFFLTFKYPNSSFARKTHALFTQSIKSQLIKAGRPDLIPSLVPDYPIGCKRICFSSDYYDAIAKDNVTLITNPIEQVHDHAIKTEDGTVIDDIDVLVLATGFETQHFWGELDIIGKNGMSLRKLWNEQDPKTYKTVLIHGYPNFFMLLGPGTILGHSSVISMIESEVNYGIQCMKKMLQYNLPYIEPTESAQEKFSTKLYNDLKSRVWLTGCNSWYLNERGVPTLLWSENVTSYWWMLRKSPIRDFIRPQ